MVSGPVKTNFIVYFKTGTFVVATNKQMVDLTYLCFVFLNDRSDAWWEMQWAACQGKDNSRERAPQKLCTSPNLLSSLWFLRLVIFCVFFFFFNYYWLLREQLFPCLLPFFELPNSHWQTATDGETGCVHKQNQFKPKLIQCTEGYFWRGRGPSLDSWSCW